MAVVSHPLEVEARVFPLGDRSHYRACRALNLPVHSRAYIHPYSRPGCFFEIGAVYVHGGESEVNLVGVTRGDWFVVREGARKGL